ncbi:ABC-F family ATP-binding cassette domain-containing protein [Erysipelothrix sp. HDW6C]|uniref:ATP-binding cassette domain-containing protein n=1 Tax=Erysipelothrix sp. HDW6C TaxID=2714930 RepID=UPI00140CE22D|nr:ATP-binding cassette domain-containing protein [Erysipelothrix sp. HDW6C]QIK69505.1 ABC-F family ATP-binding cassette domain-containing protein [Erysipelothrix sp. HDW6C]
MLNITVGVKSPQGRELVAPFSLSINTKDKIAVIGEEGNGKSLFFKSLIHDSSLNDLVVDLTLSHTKTVFGYLSQDISKESLNISALDFMIEEDWDRYQYLNENLERILPHLTDADLDRPVSSFSGGERVKLQIIRLMMQRVDCYVLDEPTNDLDLPTIIWFEDWLLALDKPVLFISHDVRLISNVANRIVHFEQTHRKTRSRITVFEGDYATYVATRNSHINQHNQNVDNLANQKAKQMDRWRQLYSKVEHKLSTNTRQNPAKGRLLKKKMKAVKSMEKRFDREVIDDKIDVEDAISLRFEPNKGVHRKRVKTIDVDSLDIAGKHLGDNYFLDIYSTDKVAIIGRNGIGKSTLINRVFAEHGAIMYQDYRRNLDYDANPIDNCVRTGDREERGLITNHLGSLKFTETEMNTPMRYLSGGQKAKISLLKLVLLKPDVIVLDEPSRNLSPLSVSEIYTMLQNYQGAIVCITHDRSLIDAVFNQVLEFTEEGFKKMPVD